MAPETCTFNCLFPPTFTSPVSCGAAPLMQRAETGSTKLTCITVHVRSYAGVNRTFCGRRKDNWGAVRIKTVQIKMAVVIRVIYVTVIIVCYEHVLGQSLSLGKCPSYPAIKKLDLKKVCTTKLFYFIFLIQCIKYDRSVVTIYACLCSLFLNLR